MTYPQALALLKQGGSPLASWGLTSKDVDYFICYLGEIAKNQARR